MRYEVVLLYQKYSQRCSIIGTLFAVTVTNNTGMSSTSIVIVTNIRICSATFHTTAIQASIEYHNNY